jgi:hypothetical protein
MGPEGGGQGSAAGRKGLRKLGQEVLD